MPNCKKKRKATGLQKVAVLLAVAMLPAMLPAMLAGCDELEGGSDSNVVDETENMDNQSGEGDSMYSETIQTLPHYEPLDFPMHDFTCVFDDFQLLNLYKDKSGLNLMEEHYKIFCEEADKKPDESFIPYQPVNELYALTSKDENRENVVWTFNEDGGFVYGTAGMSLPWKLELVSTADDFALVSTHVDTGMIFVTGFVDGRLYDNARYMGSDVYNELATLINNEGYMNVLNAVRDEFFGRMWIAVCDENGEYTLGAGSQITQTFNPDGTSKHPKDFIYRQTRIAGYTPKGVPEYWELTPKYDISNNYIQDTYGEDVLGD